MTITEKYAVKSQNRLYDGIALFHHALVNTTPDITKTILVDGKEVKMRDMEATQLANTKIDEIRTEFSRWLLEQSLSLKSDLPSGITILLTALYARSTMVPIRTSLVFIARLWVLKTSIQVRKTLFG